MKCFIVLILLFFIVNFVKTDTVSAIGYTAELTGDQVVPRVNTESNGIAQLGLDLIRSTLQWNITIFGISQSDIVGASVCGPSGPGENAPTLFPVDITFATSDDTSVKISGSYVLLNNPNAINSLNVGLLYLIIGTVQYPEGEIRGQIQTTANKFSATLSPQLVSPPVHSNANGFAVIHIDYNLLTINLDIQHTCENVTEIHIHAPEGMTNNGPVLFSFRSEGNRFQKGFNLTKTESDYLRDGLMSLDIHTVQFPQGEVRGTFLIDTVEEPKDDPNHPDGGPNNHDNDKPPPSSTSKNTSIFIIVIVSLIAIIVLMAFIMLTIIVLTNFRKSNLPSLKRKNKKNHSVNSEDVEALVEEENL